MAYQTNTEEFFDYLNQLLIEKRVNETIKILSDATSSDPTLHGDLKFLKLRVNKKLMVPAGSIGKPPTESIRNISKLINEMKNAHSRRNVIVSTLTEPSSQTFQKVQKGKSKKTTGTKKRSILPWVLLLLLLGGGAASYFFKDKILQNEYIQKVIPEGWTSTESNATVPAKNTSNKKPAKKTKPTKTTSSKKTTSNRSNTNLGNYYIQIASYGELNQALNKRERVEMSFDRAIVLQKKIDNESNYRVVIPGFSNKDAAEDFKADRKVNSLHVGAFTRAFNNDCRNLQESDSNIYVCK